MTIQANPKERPLDSDPLESSPRKSPHRYRQSAFPPHKTPQETVPSSPRSYPVSTRAYNKKDYNYIASFPRAIHVGLKPNCIETELLQCHEVHNRCADDVSMASKMHPSKQQQSHGLLPEFGAWNTSSSAVEGYTDVFDCAREQKKGGSLPAQSRLQHLQTPVKGQAKEVAVAKLPLQVSTHHRKRSSLRWSRCFVAPATTE